MPPHPHTLFLVDTDTVSEVGRVPQSHHEFNEAWVRDLLVRAPASLPVVELRGDAGAFLPIGIEIPLNSAGKADILGVTTGGYPVVVETKLWRNPQARREVLAQTIDYVKEIARHDYAWFEKLWADQRRASAVAERSLYQAADDAGAEELDESEFVDRISRACRGGDILGFIVGDGIQTGLAELVAHLCRESAHLRYSLALVELQCFRLDDNRLAVLPNLLREVAPVERAYIRVEPIGDLAESVAIKSVARPANPTGDTGRHTLTADEFWRLLESAIGEGAAARVHKFVDDLTDAADLVSEFKQRALMLKIPDPAEIKSAASAFAINSNGTAFNSRHARKQAAKWGIPTERAQEIFDHYYGRVHGACPGFPLESVHHLDKKSFVPITEFMDCLDEIASAIEELARQLRAERTSVEDDE